MSVAPWTAYPIQARLGMPKTRPNCQTTGEPKPFSAQTLSCFPDFIESPRRAGRFLFPCFPRFPESPDKRKGRSRFRELVARDSEYCCKCSPRVTPLMRNSILGRPCSCHCQILSREHTGRPCASGEAHLQSEEIVERLHDTVMPTIGPTGSAAEEVSACHDALDYMYSGFIFFFQEIPPRGPAFVVLLDCFMPWFDFRT
jgi:hypothetical protein